MSLADVQAAQKSVTGRDDTNDEMAITYQEHLNYVKQISPAPLAINCLGQIALMSVNINDFELKVTEDKLGPLQYTNFKSNLMQVCNSGHRAFQEAHVQMFAIKKNTDGLPVSMKDVVKILVNGDRMMMEKTLPRALGRIKDIADNCHQSAQSVERKFELTQEQISKLLEICFESKAEYEKDKEELEIQKEQAELNKEILKKREKEQEEKVKKFDTELEKRVKAYDEAMSAVPNGWNLIGMNAVEGLLNAVPNAVNGVASAIASGGSMGKMGLLYAKNATESALNSVASNLPSIGRTQEEDHLIDVPAQLSQGDIDLLRVFATTIPDQINILMERMEDDGKKAEDLSIFKPILILIPSEYSLNIGHASKKIKKQAEPFYKKFMELIKTMKSSWKSYDLDRARSELSDMHFEAMVLGAMYNAATNGGTMEPQTPHASTARSNAVGKRPSVAQTAAEMAQFKVSQAQENLHRAEDRYEEMNNKLMETNEKYSKVLHEMARIDAGVMKTSEVLGLLKKGLKVLGDLKQQWSDLTIFFRQISILITVSNKELEVFRGLADDVKDGVALDKTMRDLIYGTTRKAIGYGYVVNRMSTKYHEISTEYLMEPVSSLGHMMALDNESPSKVQRMKIELHAKSQEANDKIIAMQNVERENFKLFMEQKMAKINDVFGDIVKSIPEERKKEIEEQICAGSKAIDTPDDTPDAEDW